MSLGGAMDLLLIIHHNKANFGGTWCNGVIQLKDIDKENWSSGKGKERGRLVAPSLAVTSVPARSFILCWIRVLVKLSCLFLDRSDVNKPVRNDSQCSAYKSRAFPRCLMGRALCPSTSQFGNWLGRLGGPRGACPGVGRAAP